MWKNIVNRGRPIWRMRIACWIPKATNTHSSFILLIAFPPQQWLQESYSVLRYINFACLAISCVASSTYGLCVCNGLVLSRITLSDTHITFCRTTLDDGSASCRDLYMTTHNTHKTETSMMSAGFEPATPASERPQTHALDRAATWVGGLIVTHN